ncbi:GumC family protein [Flavihumibacter petaseus]|uniref:Tyrosine-protein kinase n=1 Tax=Flavihumibacter petaseus NBRC 106054 TaxID=1220578 RepID=A0A0E9N4M6_9BACT|nr:GNVR domain-containing protein [Flavihumibacter petaseus]GAO44320.1 putative protein-tyrosine kinase [Flavihumibacter petaseus NBRC 106054]
MAETTKVPTAKKEQDIFKVLVQRYVPYIPMFVLVVLICGILAFLYSRITVRTYEITATVLIQDQKKGMDESKMLEALDVFKGKKIVENEVEVLHSRALMRQVVKNLGLYSTVTQQQGFKKMDVYSNAPFYIRLKSLEDMVIAEDVPFVYKPDLRQVVIEGKPFPLNQWVNTKWGELSFISNNNYNPPAEPVEYTFSISPVKTKEEKLIKSLEVITLNKLASLVTLRLNDSDPKRGEDILNELLSLYTKAEVEDKNILAGNILNSVENRLRFVVGQLDSVENAIQRFRSNQGVIDISQQGKLYLENVGQYDKQLQDVNIKVAVLDEVEKYINSKNVSGTVMPSALGVEDPALGTMITKLNDAQSEYDKLRKTTAEQSPLIVGIRDQIDKLRPAIQDMVTNQKRNLQITKQSLTSTSERYTAMLGSIPQKEKQLLEISRQQSIKNEIYSYLLQRREEAALSYSTAKADSKVIDAAESSEKPVSPKMSVIYLASAIFGTVLAALFIAVKETFNRTVLFRKEIEEISHVPVIGELIHVRKADPVVYQDKEKDFAVEQFRSLRNALTIGAGKENNQTIFISSAMPNEGKSFVSLNLALSLAALSKRTLLIDLDVDHHKVSTHAGMDGKLGIGDYLTDGKNVHDIVHKSALHPFLSVLPFGTLEHSGVEIGGSEKVTDLFRVLKTQFDHIVVSGGAYSLNANAQAISQLADASVFVIRHGMTPKSALLMLTNEGKLEGLKRPYLVFNDVRKRGWMKGGYGFGFGYGYELKPAF